MCAWCNRPNISPQSKHISRILLDGRTSVRDRIGIYFQISDLFQKSFLSLTWQNHKHSIDSHCKNFNSLILSCQTWNIPRKCPSQIFTACRSDLDISWECFMCDNSELSCWNFYNGSQWGVYDFAMLEIGHFFGINQWFENKSQFDPLPWYESAKHKFCNLKNHRNTKK